MGDLVMESSYMDEMFDKCLERLRDGESVDQILLSYPDQRADLEPLLHVSAATMRVVNTVAVESVVEQRRLNTFMSAVTSREGRQDKFHWARGWYNSLGRSAVVALGLGVLATGTAFGASMASDGSVPGDALYPVKSLREDISLRMPKSDLDRAKQHAHLANVRNQEIGQLVDRGRYDDAQQLVVQVTYHLSESAEILGVTITANVNSFELPLGKASPNRIRNGSERVRDQEDLKAPDKKSRSDIAFEDQQKKLKVLVEAGVITRQQADEKLKIMKEKADAKAELASYMESDVGRYERRVNLRMQRMADFQREQMRLLQWQWELRYRAYVRALAHDGFPPWLVWIDSQVPSP